MEAEPVEAELTTKNSANLQKSLRQVVTEFIKVLSDRHFVVIKIN